MARVRQTVCVSAARIAAASGAMAVVAAIIVGAIILRICVVVVGGAASVSVMVGGVFVLVVKFQNMAGIAVAAASAGIARRKHNEQDD